MAGPSINTKIKLDGEKEYKAALAEINSGLRVLKSELNLASAQFKDNAGSVDALSKKNDILERSILTQQEKIEKLKEALQYAGKEYGKSSEKTNGWKIALNNAEAELAKMQGELDANTDALKKMTSPLDKVRSAFAATKEQGGGVKTALANLKEEFNLNTDSAKGLGTALTDIAGQFGVQLPDGVQNAVSALNGINAGAAFAATGVGLVIMAIVKVTKALIDMTKGAGEAASEIRKLSSVTGQSTDSIQEFDYAAEMIGVSSDRIRDSLKETTNKMQEARDGNEATAEAYAKLGIAIVDADGNLRNAEDVFYDTIDALGHMENRTERDAIAMDLLSESAQELNPLIDAGTDALKQYAAEAHEMGYVLDEDALTALDGVDDGFQALGKTTESIKKQMAAEFAPYMSEALQEMRELIQKVGTALVQSGAVDAFGSILQSVISLLDPLGALIVDFLPDLAEHLRTVAMLAAGVADTLNAIVGVLTGNWDRVGTALGLNAKSGTLSNMQRASGEYNGYRYSSSAGWIEKGTYTDAELRAMYEEAVKNGTANATFEAWRDAGSWRRHASGSDYFIGGRTLIGEYGPEEVVLPQGTRILTAQETRQASGGDTFYITIPANTVKEFNDIVNIARNKRRTDRMGVDKE